jgi:hypothetical protein
VDPRYYKYAAMFGISFQQMWRLGQKVLDQLDACPDDSTRRVLMGRGHTEDPLEQARRAR